MSFYHFQESFEHETIGSYKGDSFDARILTWFARINTSFPLPLGTNAQINGYYRGPRENAQRKTKGLVGFSWNYWNIDFVFQTFFLKVKKLLIIKKHLGNDIMST